MLKEFIEHIQETTRPQIQGIDGTMYAVTGSGTVNVIGTTPARPDTLDLNSLDALVKLIQTEAIARETPLYITIPDPLTVRCFGQPNDGDRYYRQVYYEVHATDVPGWDITNAIGFEEMQVMLRTRFQETPDTIYALKLLSDITTGAKVTYNDNGIATTVVTQKGVSLQSNEVVRPLLKLRPYRTFQEIEQPEGVFLVRLSERGIRLLEADGGMWKLAARETIWAHLNDELEKEVADGRVIIAL